MRRSAPDAGVAAAGSRDLTVERLEASPGEDRGGIPLHLMNTETRTAALLQLAYPLLTRQQGGS